jgi:hypothetical protein
LAHFALAIGPRLVRSAVTPPRLFGLEEAALQRGFLCVFADARAKEFPELARSLAPLAGRHGVLTILFPQGAQPDELIAERLRALAWPVPFVLDHLAEAYTHTLLPDETALPAVALVTSEGRLLLESSWKADLATELTEALDAGHGVSGSALTRPPGPAPARPRSIDPAVVFFGPDLPAKASGGLANDAKSS